MTTTSPVPDSSTASGAVRPVGRRRSSRVAQILGWAGTIYFVLLVISAIAAPLIAVTDPIQQNLGLRYEPPVLAGGTWEYPLGTDNLGRDVFSRIVYGSRVSLIVAGSAVLLSMVIGTILGLIAGYGAGAGGWIGAVSDRLIMLFSEMALAIPGILLAIAVAAVFGSSVPILIGILTLFGWVVFARLVRGALLSLHSRGFVEASKVLGSGHVRIVRQHMFPHVVGHIVVIAPLQIGYMILVETALGFLGLGIRPPTPTWGTMVAEGRVTLGASPWVAIFSGLAITLAVLSVNFMGDLLRGRLTAGSAVRIE